MKTRLVAMLTVVVVLSALSVSAYAEQPTEVSGELDYWFFDPEIRSAGPNSFMHAKEHEVWRGDFAGEGDSEFTVGMFAAGFWNVSLRCTFTGTVDGREGTLELQMVGKKPLGADWYGQWVILGGTGELANAHGRGIWWGPGYRSDEKTPGDPDCSFSGQIHFDPD
jgi:hypothetical protein